jgi:DNA mismatch endonuclease (patch repair protein)
VGDGQRLKGQKSTADHQAPTSPKGARKPPSPRLASGKTGGMDSVVRRTGDPVPASQAVRERFQRMPSRDTLPELALRRELHQRGLRYRVDIAPLAGLRRRADIVFTRQRLAVFVDGCFWHRCPDHGTDPKNNADWWRAKLDKNVQRDRDTDAVLVAAGWLIVRVWEHTEPVRAADIVQAELIRAAGK